MEQVTGIVSKVVKNEVAPLQRDIAIVKESQKETLSKVTFASCHITPSECCKSECSPCYLSLLEIVGFERCMDV